MIIFKEFLRGNEDPHGCIRVWFAPEYEETYINDRLIRSILPGPDSCGES